MTALDRMAEEGLSKLRMRMLYEQGSFLSSSALYFHHLKQCLAHNRNPDIYH